jgi:hypothetical protein
MGWVSMNEEIQELRDQRAHFELDDRHFSRSVCNVNWRACRGKSNPFAKRWLGFERPRMSGQSESPELNLWTHLSHA